MSYRNILYALGPKQELTPGASITWAFDGRPAFVAISVNGTLTVTGPLADFPMVGLMVVHHTVAGTTLSLTGDSSNVVWSTGAGQHTILEFTWDGSEYVWTSRTKSTTAALTQLSTPASFAATAASDTQINLTWADVANESSYLIEVSDTGSGGWSTLATPAAGSTSYNHTGLTAETTKYYRIKAVGDGATYSDSAYATANATTDAASTTTIPTTNLSAYWTFEEASGDFVDSHNAHHLVRSGGASTVAGKIGNGVELLHASNQYLTGPTSAALGAGASGFTIAGWVYVISDTGTFEQVASKWGAQKEWSIGWSNYGFSITVSTDGTSATYIGIDTPGFGLVGWHFFCARWNGTQLQIRRGDQAFNSIACSAIHTGSGAAFMVGRSESDAGTYQANVRLDELGIWQMALTDAEVDELYNTGAGKTY